MNTRDILAGSLATILGMIILGILFPWWLVTVFFATIAFFAVKRWVFKAVALDSSDWEKRITTVTVILILTSLTLTLVDYKWPWLAEAARKQIIYSTFKATDGIHPKYPSGLAMVVYRTKIKQLEAEERKITERLGVIQGKLNAGKELGPNEKAEITAAERKRNELDEAYAEIRLSRPNGKSWIKSIRSKDLVTRTLWFGALFLISGAILMLFTLKKSGRTIVGIGVLALMIAIGLVFYEPEAKAGYKAIAKPLLSEENSGKELQDSFLPLKVSPEYGKPKTDIRQNPDGSWQMSVFANRLIVDSTLQVEKGQEITILATGQVNGCNNSNDRAYSWVGPNGRKDFGLDRGRRRPLPESPFMALAYKIDESDEPFEGDWLLAGSQSTFTAPRAGILYFTVNDDTHSGAEFRPKWRQDNEGKFIVKVFITKSS